MRRVRILIAMIAAFLIMVPAALTQVKPPQPVSVPNVAGMSLSAAQKALVSAGFNAVVTQENVTDPGKNNVVLKQQIAPGTPLAKGSNVPVVVGKYTAPTVAPVPNATGMKVETARQVLEKQGWSVGVQDRPVADSRQAGMVLQQAPPPGTQVQQKNQLVTLYVGKAQEAVQVPQVVGARANDANQALLGKGFKVNSTYIETQVKEHDGFVVKQDPAAGQKVNPGTVVTLAVNRFKDQPVAVPMVTNASAQQATSMLLSKGFKVSSTYIDTPMKEKNGYVNKQNPPAGQTANPGTVVTLEVYRFKEDPTVKMPNLVGMKYVDAKNTLEQLGLKANSGFIGNNNPALGGLVQRQVVPPGTSVKKGETVVFHTYMTVEETRKLKELTDKAKMQPKQYNPPIPPDAVTK